MSVQPLFTPPRMGDLDLPRGLIRTRRTNGVRSARKRGVFDCSALVPITSCGKVDNNLPDRAAYLGHCWTAHAALTRGLAVHPGDVVFASSGGQLPSHFVGGHVIGGKI